jgi:2-octaprenyl-6-methoxyphenol hydroxylase
MTEASSQDLTADPRAGALRTKVLIVGGGMAGLTLAAALGSAGVRTIIVDRESEAARTADAFDVRTTALSFGSRRLMEGAGIWDKLAPVASPILDIRIADGQAPVFLHYDHREVGDEPFGHIVENRLIRLAQFERLAALPAVTALAGVGVAALERRPGIAEARLADGRRIKAELVVGADGRGSFVRRTAGIETVSWRYNQKAIACTIVHENPHNGLAVEHFLPAGPFATLPMTDGPDGAHRSSIVWTETADLADRFAALSDDDFLEELGKRAGAYLGAIRLIGRRYVYPLGVLHANAYVAERLALVGEAAHAIHPIAGQGLNMGMRDVAALAEIVADTARLGLDVGAAAGLARYQRWRRFDNVTLTAVTDGLDRLFSNAIPPVQLARDAGLDLVGRIPPLKKFFMRHAMGMVGELPRLLKGERL